MKEGRFYNAHNGNKLLGILQSARIWKGREEDCDYGEKEEGNQFNT